MTDQKSCAPGLVRETWPDNDLNKVIQVKERQQKPISEPMNQLDGRNWDKSSCSSSSQRFIPSTVELFVLCTRTPRQNPRLPELWDRRTPMSEIDSRSETESHVSDARRDRRQYLTVVMRRRITPPPRQQLWNSSSKFKILLVDSRYRFTAARLLQSV